MVYPRPPMTFICTKCNWKKTITHINCIRFFLHAPDVVVKKLQYVVQVSSRFYWQHLRQVLFLNVDIVIFIFR